MRRRGLFYNQHDFDNCCRENTHPQREKDKGCNTHCKHPPCLSINYGTKENFVGIEIDGKKCKLNLCVEKDDDNKKCK